MLTEQDIVKDADLVTKIKDAATAPGRSQTKEEFLKWLSSL